MDREAFADRQHAIRAEAAALVRETIALRDADAALRRNVEVMRAAARTEALEGLRDQARRCPPGEPRL